MKVKIPSPKSEFVKKAFVILVTVKCTLCQGQFKKRYF